MPTGDLINSSDGQLAIKVGPWAKDKLHYISQYCHIFNVGMRKRWSNRIYIDLFAGPGICVVEQTNEEIPGSPLVALSCDTEFTKCFFNDLRPELIGALQYRVKNRGFNNAEFFSGDCNSVVNEILDKLPDNSLDFCFIDPLKWEMKFKSIQKLTKDRRMDLAITFHVGSIKRSIDNPPKELKEFFSNSGWKQISDNLEGNRRLTARMLLDAYIDGLTEIGYSSISDYVLEKNSRNVPLYHLIFASKHERGTDFWNKIAVRSMAGQLRMPIWNAEN